MAASMSLELADQIFEIAHGKNPWRYPMTHISQLRAMQQEDLVKQAQDVLVKHVRTWYDGPAWVDSKEHMDLATYLREVAGYKNLNHAEVAWALAKVSGYYRKMS